MVDQLFYILLHLCLGFRKVSGQQPGLSVIKPIQTTNWLSPGLLSPAIPTDFMSLALSQVTSKSSMAHKPQGQELCHLSRDELAVFCCLFSFPQCCWLMYRELRLSEVSRLVCTEQFSLEKQSGVSAAPLCHQSWLQTTGAFTSFYIPPEAASGCLSSSSKCFQCSCPLNSKTSFLLNIRSCFWEFLTVNMPF